MALYTSPAPSVLALVVPLVVRHHCRFGRVIVAVHFCRRGSSSFHRCALPIFAMPVACSTPRAGARNGGMGVGVLSWRHLVVNSIDKT